jgi:hypothetical protein
MQLAGARTAARVAVALALAAATLLPGLPARAADCAGVTAVVDFGALGGGVQEKCVADGAGRPAWDVFDDAGFTLTEVQQYPGAVCRVLGKPANDPCYRMPPANAYWGLFWSDGGGWVYSTKGAKSLTVPAGGSVGLAWQSSTAKRAPGTTLPSPSPTPTKAPTKKAATSTTTKAATKPRAVSTGATPTPAPSAPSTAAARVTPSASASVGAATVAPTTTAPSPSATPTIAEAAGPVESRPVAQQGGGSLPWFVPVGVLVLLAGGAGGTTWWRRRAAG